MNVRRAFDAAAPHYDSAAELQRQVCDQLWQRLLASPAAAPSTILDAGCGTGYAARQLHAHWPQAQLLRLDFAAAMLAQGASTAPGAPLCANIEALPLANNSIDLVWSSLAIQWCDAPRAFAEFARVLRPGGRLALATLGPATFAELRQAFAGLDQHRHVIDFAAPAQLAAAATAAGLTAHLEAQTQATWHPDLRSLLRGIKTIGAHSLAQRRPGLFGKAAWRALQDRYEAHRQATGLPASYDVIYCLAEKQ